MEKGILEKLFFNIRLVLIQSLSCIMPFCRSQNQFNLTVSRGTQKKDSKTRCSQFDQIVSSIYGDIEQIGMTMPYECQRSRYPVRKHTKHHRSVRVMDGSPIVNMSEIHFDINGNRHLFAKSALSMDFGATDAITSPNLSYRNDDDRERLNVAERDNNSSTDDFRYQYPDRIKRHVDFTLNSPDEEGSLFQNNNRTINKCDSFCPSPSDETLTPYRNKPSKFDNYVSPADSKLINSNNVHQGPVNNNPPCYCDHCVSKSENMQNKRNASVISHISPNRSDDSNKFKPTRRVAIRETKYNYNCIPPSTSSLQNSPTHVHPGNKEVKYTNDTYFTSNSSDEDSKYIQNYPCQEVTYDNRSHNSYNSYNSYYNSPTNEKESTRCLPPSCKHSLSSSSGLTHGPFDFSAESDDEFYPENERRRNSYDTDFPSPIPGILNKRICRRRFKEIRIRDENDSYLNSPHMGYPHTSPNTFATEKCSSPNTSSRKDFKIESSSFVLFTSEDDKKYHILTPGNSKLFQRKLEKITMKEGYKCFCDHVPPTPTPTLKNIGCGSTNKTDPKCICYNTCNCARDPNNCECPTHRLTKMINNNKDLMEHRKRAEHIHHASSNLSYPTEAYVLRESESTVLTMDENHNSSENFSDKKITSPDRHKLKKFPSYSLSSLSENRSVGCPKSISYMSACNSSCISPEHQGYHGTTIPNCVINHLVDHNVAFHVVKVWDDDY